MAAPREGRAARAVICSGNDVIGRLILTFASFRGPLADGRPRARFMRRTPYEANGSGEMRNGFLAWRRDWRRWSGGERAAAILVLILLVALAVGLPILGTE